MASLNDKCTCVLDLPGCGYPPVDPIYPERDQKWLAISYAVCVFVVFLFAFYAVVRFTLWMRRERRDQTTEEFCTARGTAGGWRVAYSFFASAVGAWCIAAPPSFAVYSGILGLAMYAFASGAPVLVLALCGAHIVKKHEGILSVGDFAGRRFGPTFKTLVVLISLFNMGIAMLAEYTTIGSLFEDFVGSVAWPMIITVGILTMAYTMYGGLYISILTDQIQAILTIIFITVLTIYVAVTFRAPLPKPLPNDVNMSMDYDTNYVSWPLGVNKFGYSAIFSMPCALMASTVFSEAMWQKVWASESKKALVFGGSLGCLLITIAVFLFGLGGWLAAWAGYVDFTTNANLYLFQVFKDELNSDAPVGVEEYASFSYYGVSARVQSWVGIITLMLAVTMNESAIDSMQTGITSAISTQWFKNQHIFWTRLVVMCINIPIMIIATRKYTILQLFLLANMLTTCWFLPVLAGLWDCTTNFVGETGVVFGGSVSLLTTIAYGSGRAWSKAADAAEAISCGSWYTWWGDYNYDWDQFLVAAGSSVVGMVLWGVPAHFLRMAGIKGPGISGVLKYVPGFKFITGDGLNFDLMEAIGLGRFNPPKPDSDGGFPEPDKGAVNWVESTPTAPPLPANSDDASPEDVQPHLGGAAAIPEPVKGHL